MITVDSSALVALLNRVDRDHDKVAQALTPGEAPFFVPALIMAEAAYVIDRRLGQLALDRFLNDVQTSMYLLDCGESDIARIRALVAKYSDMPLGFADAAVIACAERHGGRVLTLDHRHFGLVARDAAITILP